MKIWLDLTGREPACRVRGLEPYNRVSGWEPDGGGLLGAGEEAVGENLTTAVSMKSWQELGVEEVN